MSLLIVVAEATRGGFYVGGGSQDLADYAVPAIAVSITKSDGTPLGGLGIKNFSVRFLADDQLNPTFLQATVAVAKEQLPGLYLLALQPASAVVPQKACQKLLYAIAVSQRGVGHGQTLTSLEWC